MHTLISVNKNSLLSLQYLLRKTVVSWSFFEGLFRVSQFFPQSLNVGRDLKHFLCQPILYTVSAKLYVLQSRLRNHRWSLLISKIALLSISVLWNGGEGGGEGGTEFARQVYFKQYFSRFKRNNFKSHFNLPCCKICTSRIYFGLLYASRVDPLPPSCFTMFIFSLIELRLTHK